MTLSILADFLWFRFHYFQLTLFSLLLLIRYFIAIMLTLLAFRLAAILLLPALLSLPPPAQRSVTP